jgi:excisionase family DNA binding protein
VPEKTDPIDALAYTTTQAAAVTGRSHTRIKKAIREEELTARKDGRATLIERTELARWIASLPTKGRNPEQEHVAASGSMGARHEHDQARTRPTPLPRPRSLAMSNAVKENPRR